MFFPKTYFPNLNAHRNSAAGAPRCSSFELGKNATENVASFEVTSLEKIPNYPTTQRNTTNLNITRTRAWEQCQHYAPKSKQSKLLNMLETENKFTYLPIYLMKEINSYRNVLGAWLDRSSRAPTGGHNWWAHGSRAQKSIVHSLNGTYLQLSNWKRHRTRHK